MYYRNANCAVVVYDITQSASLEKARTWIRELQRQADPSIVIALCGNKTDLEARRQVSQEEAKKYADEEGLMWAETSAKTGEGVQDIFTAIGAQHNNLNVPQENRLTPFLQPRSFPSPHHPPRGLVPRAPAPEQALTWANSKLARVRKNLATADCVLLALCSLMPLRCSAHAIYLPFYPITELSLSPFNVTFHSATTVQLYSVPLFLHFFLCYTAHWTLIGIISFN
jgi:Ras-related protein Rab-5C